MNTIKFNPMNPSRSIFDEVFNDFFNMDMVQQNKRQARYTEPLSNISEDKDKFLIELAVPGMKKEDIQINIEKDQLEIKAVSKEEKSEDDTNYSRREFYYGDFSKSFHLPESVDRNQVHASFENGVLILSLMKKEEAIDKGPQYIEIK